MFKKCSVDGIFDDKCITFWNFEKGYHVVFCQECWHKLQALEYRQAILELIQLTVVLSKKDNNDIKG